MLKFHNKVFVCTSTESSSEIATETTFYFKQIKNIVKATYNGKGIVYGELIGMINNQGILQATFNYLNAYSRISGGTCTMILEGNTLRGIWTVVDENLIESELILEEI